MVSSSREDIVEKDQISNRKFWIREGVEDQLQSAVNLTRVSPTHLPPIHLPSSERCCGEDIAWLAEFVIKSNGDGQTRARIVTSNRIILRHGVPAPPSPRFHLLSPCSSSRIRLPPSSLSPSPTCRTPPFPWEPPR